MTGFYVSFKALHPVLDVSDLLAPPGVVPPHCWKAGDQRRTPQGTRFEGTHDLSYYCCDLPLPESSDLAEWLEQAVDFLRPLAKQLLAFVEGGGSLSFYVGLEKGVFEGATFGPTLLAELGAFRVSLDIDRNL